jgi:hypothetical protein
MINGCMNRPDQDARSGYLAQDGWDYSPDGGTRQPIMVWIPHTMSRECEYSKSTVDAACDGCVSKREAV